MVVTEHKFLIPLVFGNLPLDHMDVLMGSSMDLRWLKTFGSRGEGVGEFGGCVGLALDLFGNLIVVESSNNRVQIFDYETCTSNKVFGTRSSDMGQFSDPWGVDVDKQGNIIVADMFNHRIQIFDRDGQYLSQIGERGNKEGQFTYPTTMVLDRAGNIVVIDTDNNRIQVFG